MAAYNFEHRIGGCLLAYNTDGVNKPKGGDDVVAMWDVRVHPTFRRQGVGRMLFEAAVRWARDRGCRELKVETQNINVPACRFYEQQGCRLSSIDREAYHDFPDEIELNWTLDL